MQTQKTTGWNALREAHAPKKIVLSGDSPTIEALRSTQWLKLRLFGQNGSSMIVTLDNKADTVPSGNGLGSVTVSVSREQLVGFYERDLEVIFWDERKCTGVAFRAMSLSKDAWLADIRPLCEPLQ
jgi:hypothetical protein